MKKLALILTILLALCPLAFADTAEEEETLPQRSAYEVAEAAENALRLTSKYIFVDEDWFDGAPNANIAWGGVAQFIAENEQETDSFTMDELELIYKQLFHEGNLSELPVPDGSRFTKDGDVYHFRYDDGDIRNEIAINDIAETEDGNVSVDFTTWYRYDGGDEEHGLNGIAILVPNEDALFGANVRSIRMSSRQGFGEMSATATATLAPQEGNTYDAKNVLDGRYETCWAYDAEKHPNSSITLTFENPVELRGLMIVPGYAKSERVFLNNRRVRLFTITFSDGTTQDYELRDNEPDGYANRFIFAFGAVHDVDSVQITVTDTFAGERFDDLCISEIMLF